MTIDAAGLDLLFREARTHNKWHEDPVSDETIHELYDLLKQALHLEVRRGDGRGGGGAGG